MQQRRHPPGFLLAACAAVGGVSLTLGTVGPLLPRFSASMDSGLYAGLVIAQAKTDCQTTVPLAP